jgi:hypothetical protein
VHAAATARRRISDSHFITYANSARSRILGRAFARADRRGTRDVEEPGRPRRRLPEHDRGNRAGCAGDECRRTGRPHRRLSPADRHRRRGRYLHRRPRRPAERPGRDGQHPVRGLGLALQALRRTDPTGGLVSDRPHRHAQPRAAAEPRRQRDVQPAARERPGLGSRERPRRLLPATAARSASASTARRSCRRPPRRPSARASRRPMSATATTISRRRSPTA